MHASAAPARALRWCTYAATRPLPVCRRLRDIRSCLPQAAGDWVSTSLRRPPGGELISTQRTVNRAAGSGPGPRVERGMARLQSGQILRQPQLQDLHHQGRPHLKEPTLTTLSGVGGVVVAQQVHIQADGRRLADSNQEHLDLTARWRRWSSDMTLPSAMLKEANRLVKPCR